MSSEIREWWARLEEDRLWSMIDQAGFGRPRNVLHIGVGAGDRIAPWKERFPIKSQTGLDLDLPSVLQLPLPRRIWGTGESLPFRDSTFDLVLGVHTFHHFNDPIRGMEECLRVGRTLAIIEPLESPIVKILTRLGIIAEEEFGERIQRFVPEDISSRFRAKGFQVENATYLYKSRPEFHSILNKVHNPAVGSAIRQVYALANSVSSPMHTKFCAVISRVGDG